MRALLFIAVAATIGFLVGLVGAWCNAWAWKADNETWAWVTLATCWCALFAAGVVAARVLL